MCLFVVALVARFFCITLYRAVAAGPGKPDHR
jgi:hypothetical protein